MAICLSKLLLAFVGFDFVEQSEAESKSKFFCCYRVPHDIRCIILDYVRWPAHSNTGAVSASSRAEKVDLFLGKGIIS